MATAAMSMPLPPRSDEDNSRASSLILLHKSKSFKLVWGLLFMIFLTSMSETGVFQPLAVDLLCCYTMQTFAEELGRFGTEFPG